jgi:hypothetical protein
MLVASFTDHKPLEKLGKVHTKTLNRLQKMMNQFSFEIIYKQGTEMPAVFCHGTQSTPFNSGMSEIRDRANPAPAKSRKFRDNGLPVSG